MPGHLKLLCYRPVKTSNRLVASQEIGTAGHRPRSLLRIHLILARYRRTAFCPLQCHLENLPLQVYARSILSAGSSSFSVYVISSVRMDWYCGPITGWLATEGWGGLFVNFFLMTAFVPERLSVKEHQFSLSDEFWSCKLHVETLIDCSWCTGLSHQASIPLVDYGHALKAVCQFHIRRSSFASIPEIACSRWFEMDSFEACFHVFSLLWICGLMLCFGMVRCSSPVCNTVLNKDQQQQRNCMIGMWIKPRTLCTVVSTFCAVVFLASLVERKGTHDSWEQRGYMVPYALGHQYHCTLDVQPLSLEGRMYSLTIEHAERRLESVDPVCDDR